MQAELSALELVHEAVLPGFNAYDDALAIGSRAPLYVLRPTKRGAAASRGVAASRGRRAGALLRERPLAELLETPRAAETVYVNLAPDLVYGLYQAALAAVVTRVAIVADNHTEGLRNAEAQALLRALVGPRYEVTKLTRSWRESPFTLVEPRGDGAPRDERAVYREATSTSIASLASGAPQSSTDAGGSTP